MPRSLADGHEKVVLLTTKPTNAAAPTLTELNAGIDISLAVLASDWSFSAADSETINEPAVGESTNANVLGRTNYQFGMTLFRYFTGTGTADTTADSAFTAVKVKGTTVWIYARRTSKLATDPWAAGDEIRLGAEVLTDTPQTSESTGYVKHRIPGQVQRGYPFIAVGS